MNPGSLAPSSVPNLSTPQSLFVVGTSHQSPNRPFSLPPGGLTSEKGLSCGKREERGAGL